MRRPHLAVLTSLLACVVLAPASAQPTPDTLMDCRLHDDLVLPEPPDVASEGGYAFEYQALGGRTEDARACTVYRLRNRPAKPPTPVNWRLGDDLLMEHARLARCPEATDACPWVAVARYFEGDIATSLSLLSFGLNYDAFHHQAETLMTHFAPPEPPPEVIAAHSVGTAIRGVFAADDGREVAVDLLVKSRIETVDGVRFAVLEITDRTAARVAVAWDAFDLVPGAAALLQAAPAALAARVRIPAPDRAAPDRAAPEGGEVTLRGDTLEVRVPIERYRLVRDARLRVYAPPEERSEAKSGSGPDSGPDGALVAQVQMPVFAPAEGE